MPSEGCFNCDKCTRKSLFVVILIYKNMGNKHDLLIWRFHVFPLCIWRRQSDSPLSAPVWRMQLMFKIKHQLLPENPVSSFKNFCFVFFWIHDIAHKVFFLLTSPFIFETAFLNHKIWCLTRLVDLPAKENKLITSYGLALSLNIQSCLTVP